jgi:flavin-dependent dehydrogenase
MSEAIHLFWTRKLAGYGWYVPKQGKINIGVGAMSSKTENMDYWWHWIENQCLRLKLITQPLERPAAHSYLIKSKKSAALNENAHENDSRKGNCFLVGDALGLSTLDLGEGIEPAFESGKMAAESIVKNIEYEPQKIRAYSNRFGKYARCIPFAPVIRN